MTSYYGNQVPYGNGSWFRVRVDVTNGPTDSSGHCDVTHAYFVEFRYSISDNVNLGYYTNVWGSGTFNNTNYSFGGSGGVQTVGGPATNGVTGVGYGGTSIHFHLEVQNLAGVSGVSAVDFDYPIPARPPSPPSPPSITVLNITATSATVLCTAAGAENGATTQVINYRVVRVADGVWMGDLQAGYNGQTFTNLGPGTDYVAYAQAYNSAGWGAFSTGVVFTTLTGAKVWNGSAWVNAPVYVWNGSSWVLCEVRVWNGTAWVPSG